MRGVRLVALGAVLAITLAACFGGSSSRTRTYGVSWRPEPPDAFNAIAHSAFVIPMLEAVARAQTSYIDSPVASGYWIPDPNDPLGMIIGLQAWVREGSTRRPTAASWSVTPATGGEFSHQNVAETHFRPTAPGKYEIQAAIGDAIVTQEVEVYGGFVLDSNSILAHSGGTGFRFDLEDYEADQDEADIYIEADGTVRIPGGFVHRPEQYLHEVTGPVPMDGARTSFNMDDAQLGIMVLETRTGAQVAIHLGVTASGLVNGRNGYAYVFGHKRL